MASNEGVENRPFPYLTVDADLLSNLRQSAAEGLFHSFDLLVGKDAREAGIKFEVLLGVYTNAIQYVRFLETALAVSCVNTEFKDLSRMTDGKIQFRISVPTIAHGDGRRPSKQRTFIVVKNCHKHHISTEMELSMLDLEILHSIPETPVEYAEYVGAVKTVASALQFGVDALERGLINTVLSVKLRHAPPMFILQTLADPTFTERGFSKTVKSDLIAMFKRHLLEHSFFLDRAENMGSGFSQYVRSRLSEMVAAVSGESVLKGVSTYTTAKGGEPVGGVFIVTDNVLRQLLTFLGEEVLIKWLDTALGREATFYACRAMRRLLLGVIRMNDCQELPQVLLQCPPVHSRYGGSCGLKPGHVETVLAGHHRGKVGSPKDPASVLSD